MGFRYIGMKSETLCCGLINNKQSLHVCNLLIKIRISIIVFFQMKIKEKPEKKLLMNKTSQLAEACYVLDDTWSFSPYSPTPPLSLYTHDPKP